MTTESHENRLKRMKMRAWRRGIREMDLILGPYADTHIADFDAPDLDLFDLLLEEYDHDLMGWITGALPAPAKYSALIKLLSRHAETI